jgi:cell division control protein 6
MTVQTSLGDIFKTYSSERPIFKNKDTLSIRFAPDNIPHREKQIKQVGHIMAPLLRNEKPSNMFVYGKTGSGKTLVIRSVIDNISETISKNRIPVKIFYINCKMKKTTDTEYRLLAQLISNFGEEVPYTGLPTNELYKRFFALLDSEKQNIVLVLDEIDALIKKIGDGVLYSLTRINQELEKTKLTIIGISNNLSFVDNLDPRVKSSLSEEEIIFPPYNANELRDILAERANLAFNAGVISPQVISKCSALAAQEHGDARRALDLLRIAGETAERNGARMVEESHVDMAESKLDTDRITEILRTQPKQSQAVFKAIIEMHKKGETNIQTGDVYDLYADICLKNNLRSLTQRRVSDLIAELDMFGIINAKVLSKGRYGRTKRIKVSLPKTLIERIENVILKELY